MLSSFLFDARYASKFIHLHMAIQLFQGHLLERLALSTELYLHIFKNSNMLRTIFELRIRYTFLLIYLSTLKQIQHCLNFDAL